MTKLIKVQDFYAGKTIFITGASGFMGKVLIESILYGCPDVKEIIILMRPKRGASALERVDGFKKLAAFKRIMEEKPEVMNKIYPVFGEITKPNFDLSPEHLKRVLETSEIVFHMAASLKLEATLKPNITMNLTGTKNALDLARQMKNLVQMVHLSTAFCNIEPEIVEEKVYDFHHNPLDLIHCAEWMSEETMEALQNEIMGVHPNTYTYTKRLAEILVRDEFNKGNLPICIARPSIVTPAFQFPVAGWVDSLNGPIGIMYAGIKGVLRSMLVNGDCRFEMIPVDSAIAGLVVLTRDQAVKTSKSDEIPVYHLTIDDSRKITYGQLFEKCYEVGRLYPFMWALWYPDGTFTMNKYVNFVKVFLFQWIPAYLIDFLLLCLGKKRFMVYVQKRIAVGCEVLKFFGMRNWYFKSKNYTDLSNNLSPEELLIFPVDTINIGDEREYIEGCILGARQYCVNDPLSTLPTARFQNKIQYVLHIFCKYMFWYFIIKALLNVFGLYEPLVEFLGNSIKGFRS